MSRNGRNMTNGVFDLAKESIIVGNITADALTHPHLIHDTDVDKTADIVAKEFLVFRTNHNDATKEINTKQESNILARVIIDALLNAGIIKSENSSLAFEIAAEEILVRRAMESL